MANDRVLLVTGGSRGIGAATARLAAQRGFAVAVNYVHQQQAAENDDVAGQQQHMTLRKRWHTASKRTALKDGQSASVAGIKRGGTTVNAIKCGRGGATIRLAPDYGGSANESID